jgi:succinoglycan biosynthesis protein ExoM
MKRAAICVATYRRPDMLERLLGGLRNLMIPPCWTVEIRIVDNDEAGDDRVAAVIAGSDLRVRYTREPRRNIALARNAAVDMGPADAFLFIDDDEVPTVGWLTALLRRLDAGADGVFGPVVGRLPDGSARWLARGGFFDKPGPDHDHEIDWSQTRTSSTGVAGRWFHALGYRFDPAFGRSGGEDVDLFRRLAAAGARFVQERRALVYEDVEPERCSLRFLLRRRYRAGLVRGRFDTLERLAGRYPYPAVVLVARRLALGGIVSLAHAPALLAGRPEGTVRGLLRLATSLGAWNGRRLSREAVEAYHVRHAVPAPEPA